MAWFVLRPPAPHPCQPARLLLPGSGALLCTLLSTRAGVGGAGALAEAGGVACGVAERRHDSERQHHPPHQGEGSRHSRALGQGSPEHTRVHVCVGVSGVFTSSPLGCGRKILELLFILIFLLKIKKNLCFFDLTCRQTLVPMWYICLCHRGHQATGLDCVSYPRDGEREGEHPHLGHRSSIHPHRWVLLLSACCEHCGFPHIQIKEFEDDLILAKL